jgi:hypothetical protein
VGRLFSPLDVVGKSGLGCGLKFGVGIEIISKYRCLFRKAELLPMLRVPEKLDGIITPEIMTNNSNASIRNFPFFLRSRTYLIYVNII